MRAIQAAFVFARCSRLHILAARSWLSVGAAVRVRRRNEEYNDNGSPSDDGETGVITQLLSMGSRVQVALTGSASDSWCDVRDLDPLPPAPPAWAPPPDMPQRPVRPRFFNARGATRNRDRASLEQMKQVQLVSAKPSAMQCKRFCIASNNSAHAMLLALSAQRGPHLPQAPKPSAVACGWTLTDRS